MPAAAHAVAVVVSRYNASITNALLEGAVQAYLDATGSDGSLAIIDAPGAYELPAIALAAARTGKYQGVLTLGCIIKGQTPHDQHIGSAVAHGLMDITLKTGIPVAFGVLTTNTLQQAQDRAGGTMGNKGHQAMEALLDTITVIHRVEEAAACSEDSGLRVQINHAMPDKAAGGVS